MSEVTGTPPLSSEVADGPAASRPPGQPAPQQPPQARPIFAPFSFRALAIGLLINPFLIFWAEYTEIVSGGADLIAMSLVMAVVCALIVLIAINLIVKRIVPRWALTQAELMYIYVINSTTVGICGIGMMQFLTNNIAGAFYYGKPENGWLTWRYMIRQWAVPDPSVIDGYYTGKSNFFTAQNVMGWLTPIIVWSVFICVLLFALYCIGVLLRKSWIERERLLFPIVLIPLAITENGGDTRLWRNKIFWAGFAVAVVLECMAAIHHTLSPSFPYFPIKPSEPALDFSAIIGSFPRPWSGIGGTQIAFYPLVIGLTFLLSLDVSFSCWFFYVVLKLENVLAVAFGFRDPGAGGDLARIPNMGEQAVGAFIGLAWISLYLSWPHIKRAISDSFLRRKSDVDAAEPMSYRAATICLAVSLIVITAFACALGVPIWAAVLFIAIFFAFAIAYARIRAEAGLPWGAGPPPMAHGTIYELFGTPAVGDRGQVAFSYLRWVDNDFRCLALPNQLEAMKIADETRINPRSLTAGIAVAVLVAIAASWMSVLGIYYHYGAASAHVDAWRTGQGQYGFYELTDHLRNPLRYDASYSEWMAVGFLFTLLLSALRMRYPWWPLHPVGYAVANTGIDWIWFPLLLGWLAKWTTLRYFGLSGYRKTLPFFIGLVLGDYVISGAWAIFYLATGLPGYRTFPI